MKKTLVVGMAMAAAFLDEIRPARIRERRALSQEEIERQKRASIKAEEKRLRRQERNRRLQEKHQ